MYEVLKIAAQIGLNISEFWGLTPFEFSLVVESYYKRRRDEYEEKVSLVHLGAQLQRARTIPKLEEILKNPNKQMTDEEMLEQVKNLNKVFGGEVK